MNKTLARKELNQAVGQVVRTLRKERGISQAQAARIAGFTRPLWVQIELGMVWPSTNSFFGIARGLDIAVSEIFYVLANTLNQNEYRNNKEN